MKIYLVSVYNMRLSDGVYWRRSRTESLVKFKRADQINLQRGCQYPAFTA